MLNCKKASKLILALKDFKENTTKFLEKFSYTIIYDYKLKFIYLHLFDFYGLIYLHKNHMF